MAKVEVTTPDGIITVDEGDLEALHKELTSRYGGPRQAYGATAGAHETAIPPSQNTTWKGGAASFLEGVPVAGEKLASSVASPKEREEFKKYYPGQDWALQTGGGLSTAGAALAIPGIGEGLVAPALGASRFAGPFGNALMGTAGGAAIGGADAYARGQDWKTGAGVGAVTGALAPVAGRLGEAGYAAASDRLRPNPLPGVGARGRQILASDAANLTPQQLAYARQALGPEAFIGELTPGLQDTSKGIGSGTGADAAAIRQAYTNRLQGAPARTEDAINRELGQRVNVPQTIEQVLQDRSTNARPFYQAAEARPFPVNDPRLRELMQDPRIQAGMRRGHEDAQAEALAQGVPFQPNGWRMAFNAKTGLDNLVEEQRNDFGRLSSQGRTIGMLRDAWRQRLDDLNPDYAAARREWEGPTQVANAMREGQRALGRGFSRDEMAEQFHGYTSAAAQDAYRIGMRNNIANIMDSARRGDVTARNLLVSDAAHGKISEAFNQYRADDLRESLQHELGISERSPNIVPNPNTGASTTPRNEAVAKVNPQGAASRYFENFQPWNPKTWLGSSIDPRTHLSARDERLNQQAREQMVPWLTAPASSDPLTNALMRARERQAGIGEQAAGINRFLTTGIAVPGSQQLRKKISEAPSTSQ